jgi:hypothetical protein
LSQRQGWNTPSFFYHNLARQICST